MKGQSQSKKKEKGFSLIELIICLVITLVILGGAVAIFSRALSTRERESGRVDAITAAQAALSVMSREIGNSGYGLYQDNGLVIADCTADKIRFRANVENVDPSGGGANTSQPGEDVVYLYDAPSQSVVRFDRNAPNPAGGLGVTSGIINQVSNVDFVFHNYALDGSGFTSATSPVADTTHVTARVTINLYVTLPDVTGQPSGRIEKVSSDVTLRNAPYMLGQY
jgi:prepilin-type N-terminal cleavage/methylation domain-containing protein